MKILTAKLFRPFPRHFANRYARPIENPTIGTVSMCKRKPFSGNRDKEHPPRANADKKSRLNGMLTRMVNILKCLPHGTESKALGIDDSSCANIMSILTCPTILEPDTFLVPHFSKTRSTNKEKTRQVTASAVNAARKESPPWHETHVLSTRT